MFANRIRQDATTLRAQLPALATGLAQGPVRDGGTTTHRSFPTGSSLPSPDRAPGLGHLPTLSQRRRDGRASGVPVSGPRSRHEGHLARRHLHYRPAMPLELPGTDWGGDRLGMRERERAPDLYFIMTKSATPSDRCIFIV